MWKAVLVGSVASGTLLAVKQKEIALFWLPLFASWLLMTLEGPTVSATVNRLPKEVIMLAAQGIVVGLSVTIESPIINLLATSTALAKDRASYLLLRRFTIYWMVLLTAITVTIAYTPLFDLVVVRAMAVPDEIAQWVRSGLRIMVLWSACIAWRRFLQGIMIRYDETRKVALGTLVRLVSTASTVILLALLTDLPGIVVGATGLMVGVSTEAVYATVAVRPLLAGKLGPSNAASTQPTITLSELFFFHLPLAATSLLILLIQPLVTFSLARLPNAAFTLAAWPLVFQIMLVARAAALALPEVVIALSEEEESQKPLLTFTIGLSIVSTFAILLFVFSPLSRFYLLQVQDTTIEVSKIARAGLGLFVPLPALAVLTSWFRGLLIHSKNTKIVNAAMFVNVIATAAVLFLGIQFQWPGIKTAAVALVAASLTELVYLWLRSRGIARLGSSLLTSENRPVPG